MEQEMAAHSNIFSWKIPWTEEPGGLQFMGVQRVRHDWEANTLTYINYSTHNEEKVRILEERNCQLIARWLTKNFDNSVCFMVFFCPPGSESIKFMS